MLPDPFVRDYAYNQVVALFLGSPEHVQVAYVEEVEYACYVACVVFFSVRRFLWFCMLRHGWGSSRFPGFFRFRACAGVLGLWGSQGASCLGMGRRIGLSHGGSPLSGVRFVGVVNAVFFHVHGIQLLHDRQVILDADEHLVFSALQLSEQFRGLYGNAFQFLSPFFPAVVHNGVDRVILAVQSEEFSGEGAGAEENQLPGVRIAENIHK